MAAPNSLVDVLAPIVIGFTDYDTLRENCADEARLSAANARLFTTQTPDPLDIDAHAAYIGRAGRVYQGSIDDAAWAASWEAASDRAIDRAQRREHSVLVIACTRLRAFARQLGLPEVVFGMVHVTDQGLRPGAREPESLVRAMLAARSPDGTYPAGVFVVHTAEHVYAVVAQLRDAVPAATIHVIEGDRHAVARVDINDVCRALSSALRAARPRVRVDVDDPGVALIERERASCVPWTLALTALTLRGVARDGTGAFRNAALWANVARAPVRERARWYAALAGFEARLVLNPLANAMDALKNGFRSAIRSSRGHATVAAAVWGINPRGCVLPPERPSATYDYSGSRASRDTARLRASIDTLVAEFDRLAEIGRATAGDAQ